MYVCMYTYVYICIYVYTYYRDYILSELRLRSKHPAMQMASGVAISDERSLPQGFQWARE